MKILIDIGAMPAAKGKKMARNVYFVIKICCLQHQYMILVKYETTKNILGWIFSEEGGDFLIFLFETALNEETVNSQ